MMFILKTPHEVQTEIAQRIKALRLEQNLSQQGLCERSDVTLASLRRFERTGLIAFDSLLRLANALGRLGDFENLFVYDQKPDTLFRKEAASKVRKRGTRK